MTHPFTVVLVAILFAAMGDWDSALVLTGVVVILLAIREERG